MAELNWTQEAVRWLREIHDYIAEDSPGAAHRTIDGILRKAELLRTFPELGYRHEAPTGRDVRVILYGHYRIAYVLKADGNIDILGVFHAALDIDRYLS